MLLKQRRQHTAADSQAGQAGNEQIPQQPQTPKQQPLQQQILKQQHQQHSAGSSCYSKVTSWLNSTSSSSGKVAPARSGPLLSRATSLLWYMGLGGMLYPRATNSTAAMCGSGSTALQRQGAAGAAAAGAAAAASPQQQGQAAAAAAAASGAGAVLPGHPKPVLPTGQHFTTQSFPPSHPLTAEQVQQSAGISTSTAAGVSATAPVQAVAKGIKARGALYLGPMAAAIIKTGDDILALISSMPRTMRTLKWAAQAAVSYKRLLVTSDASVDPEGYNRQLSQLHDYHAQVRRERMQDSPYVAEQRQQQLLPASHNYHAQRLTEVCRVNGGVYVKAGQFAAAFGSVPTEYRNRLALLQDKAKPRPFHVVDRVLRLELGAGAEEVFAEFSAEATAAASLAQVHKARLADGRQVAVKVQYPGLRGAANADLTTLSCLSRFAQALFPEFRLGWLYEELRHKLTEELDFHVEIHNAQKLMACMYPASYHSSKGGSGGSSSSRQSSSSSSSDSKCGVTVPTAHVALCTSKVLTMEWIDGLKVNDSQALRAAKISPRAVGRSVDEAFAEMTFVHGYIHADPHPGNIMVRPKGRRGVLSWLLNGTWQPFEVVLLDHGSYLNISDRLRQQYCQLWCSLFVGDSAGAASVAIDLGGQRAGQILPVILTQRGRTKEEQKEMQRAAGVASFGDITQLLSTAPRDVVELLRIAAVVRNITATLGCSLADRIRVSGTWAFRGLPGYNSGWAGAGQGVSEGDKRFSQLGYRMNIQARLLVIRGYVALNSVVNRTLLATLHAFGQPVVLY